MFVIKGLRLNKFLHVNIPSRRELFERFATPPQQFKSDDENPYSDPVNNFTGSKIDMISEGQSLLNQKIAQQESEK